MIQNWGTEQWNDFPRVSKLDSWYFNPKSLSPEARFITTAIKLDVIYKEW